MKTRKLTLLSTTAMALGATLFLAAIAVAEEDKSKISRTDTRFIQDEAAAGAALVNIAAVGEKKAQREDVKNFAAMLVADHSKANTELAALAAAKGVDLSSEPAAKYGDMQEKLERTSDAQFDKAFLAMVVKAHEKCVKNFTDASTDAQDGDLKDWAAKMLPGLQAHLGEAEKLGSMSTAQVGATPGNGSDTQPDNTARNSRDRDEKTLTPMDQGNSKTDIDITAQIRREITGLDGLSVNAQNVKIITNEGRVTLRGPVDSEDEKRMIGEIATKVAGENMDNQLEVRSGAASN